MAKLLRGTGKLALQRGGELTAAQRSGGTAEPVGTAARVYGGAWGGVGFLGCGLGRLRRRRGSWACVPRRGSWASVACARRGEGDDPVEWVRAVSGGAGSACGRRGRCASALGRGWAGRGRAEGRNGCWLGGLPRGKEAALCEPGRSEGGEGAGPSAAGPR